MRNDTMSHVHQLFLSHYVLFKLYEKMSVFCPGYVRQFLRSPKESLYLLADVRPVRDDGSRRLVDNVSRALGLREGRKGKRKFDGRRLAVGIQNSSHTFYNNVRTCSFG